jgi:N-acetylmuramoyl-L-alanine amidase CwlA
MWMYIAKSWTEHVDFNGEVRARTIGDERISNLIGSIISTNQNPHTSQGLTHQPKCTQGVSMAPAECVAEECLM